MAMPTMVTPLVVWVRTETLCVSRARWRSLCPGRAYVLPLQRHGTLQASP